MIECPECGGDDYDLLEPDRDGYLVYGCGWCFHTWYEVRDDNYWEDGLD